MLSEVLCILASWFLSLMSKNSVLEEFKSEKISSHRGRDLLRSALKMRNIRVKAECHLHKGGSPRKGKISRVLRGVV